MKIQSGYHMHAKNFFKYKRDTTEMTLTIWDLFIDALYPFHVEFAPSLKDCNLRINSTPCNLQESHTLSIRNYHHFSRRQNRIFSVSGFSIITVWSPPTILTSSTLLTRWYTTHRSIKIYWYQLAGHMLTPTYDSFYLRNTDTCTVSYNTAILKKNRTQVYWWDIFVK